MKIPIAHWDCGEKRSADWQSAVSRISNPQPSQQLTRPADYQSAKQQVANLGYKPTAIAKIALPN